MAGGRITGPRTRDDAPVADDWGMVTRPIISGGPFPVTFAQPSVGTVTSVLVDALPTLILAANANRLGVTIYNDANTRLYVKLAAAPTTGSFTVRLDGQGFYEIQFPCYTGDIWAIRAAGPAALVQVTELT